MRWFARTRINNTKSFTYISPVLAQHSSFKCAYYFCSMFRTFGDRPKANFELFTCEWVYFCTKPNGRSEEKTHTKHQERNKKLRAQNYIIRQSGDIRRDTYKKKTHTKKKHSEKKSTRKNSCSEYCVCVHMAYTLELFQRLLRES